MITEKLKTIFEFPPQSNSKAENGMEEGVFPFYTSSPLLSKRIDKAQYYEESLIIGTGGSASIHYSSEPFSTSSHCIVATSKRDDINIKYVYYYLLGNIHVLERIFKGAGLQNISKADIENINIPILDINLQNKIVAILDSINSLIEKREKTILLLDELLIAFFLEMFGDPVLNSNRWNVEFLKNVSFLERGRFSARPRNNPVYFGGKHPFIQTGEISNSNYRLKQYTQTLNEKGIAISKEFKKGDIVIAIVGATIGVTSILQLNVYATDSVIAIKPHKEINNIFLEMLLRFYRKLLLETAPSGARANINLSILGDLKIILPPIKLQKNYADFDNYCEKCKERLIQSKNDLELLFKSTLQKSFNDELDFSIDFELDTLINEINLQLKENDLSKITQSDKLIKRFIEKLSKQEFQDKNLYDKAKHGMFQLLREGNRVVQEYDKRAKNVRFTLK